MQGRSSSSLLFQKNPHNRRTNFPIRGEVFFSFLLSHMTYRIRNQRSARKIAVKKLAGPRLQWTYGGRSAGNEFHVEMGMYRHTPGNRNFDYLKVRKRKRGCRCRCRDVQCCARPPWNNERRERYFIRKIGSSGGRHRLLKVSILSRVLGRWMGRRIESV